MIKINVSILGVLSTVMGLPPLSLQSTKIKGLAWDLKNVRLSFGWDFKNVSYDFKELESFRS